MKKLFVIVFALVMCFSTLAACGGKEYDDSALLDRIAQLEEELANTKGEKGDTGLQGATGPQGPAGPQGPKGDSDETVKIYKLGETFTYTCAGIDLFSIKIEAHPTPGNVNVIIKNINMPGCAPAAFVGMQRFGRDDANYYKYELSTKILLINEEYVYRADYSSWFISKIWWFGFPAPGVITPYAIFDLT